MRKIEIFYDIISPYSYLGLELFARDYAKNYDEVIVTPVALGVILNKTENPGPANITLKRPQALRDFCMQAQVAGIPALGPPGHPFNPLPALRYVTCVDDLDLRLRSALAINRACWAKGLAMTTEEAIEAELHSEGLLSDEEDGHVETLIRAKNGRRLLKAATQRALALGVFGVPTFHHQGLNFWGSDRLELLEKFASEPDFFDFASFEKMNNLPSGL